MSEKAKGGLLGLILAVFLMVPAGDLGAVVYSEVWNTNEMAWIWVPGSGGPRVPVYPADLGLIAGDDIDALSLGDDYGKFDKVRRDLFGVQAGAIGTSGDLQARSLTGVRVERDIYIEHRTKVNKVEYPDLITASSGDEVPSRGIDGFDVGVLQAEGWIYFSLAPGSPTLAMKGYSAGDVLVCQYKVAGTLTVYSPASDIGGPADISALSIHDRQQDGVYDSASDYIIYAKPIPGDATIYHYGSNPPSTHEAHEFSQFGLDSANDVVFSLEHIPLPIPEQDVGECVAPEDYYTAEASGLSTVNLGSITVEQALLPDGTAVPLSVSDCMGNGHLAVQVPWSESNATQNAVIRFDENLCPEGDPLAVGIYLAHGTSITLNAIDSSGNVVDTVSNSGSDPTEVQLLILQSETGIRKVQIEGAEICILMICYYCDELPSDPDPGPGPGPEPGPGGCVYAGDVYTAETSGLSEITLGPVTIREALLPDGTPVPLNVTDCTGDGLLEVQVPWSESNASRFAVIEFGEAICGGEAPEEVSLTVAHGTAIKFIAYDDDGVVMDDASDSGSDPTDIQTLTLSSETGIRKIEIEGAELCIIDICWFCEEMEPGPGPEPGPGGCVYAGDVYTAETSGLSEITLGPVTIREALLPDGTPVPLNVTDCTGDGLLEVQVPWSESNASRFAVIEFGEAICGGEAPEEVSLTVAHGTAIKFIAYDDDGVVMDDASDSGSDPTDIQTLTLSSETGIRKIEIEGAELCIIDICWFCEEMEPGPGPEPGPEPGPCPERPQKIVVYEFDQIDLATNGWVELPGGFTGASAGRILPFDFSPEMIPSSIDSRGLAFSVKTGEVATIHTATPVNTNGAPILIRMTARASASEAAIALAVLKGDVSTGQNLDWSIATHVPTTATAFVQEERRMVLVYEPDSGQTVTPIIQVASTLGPEQSKEVSVIVDRLEVLRLDPKVFGSTPTGPSTQPEE